MPQFGASLTAIIYAPRVVNYALIFINYAPRVNYYIPKKIIVQASLMMITI
jgi:hypothetical protein